MENSFFSDTEADDKDKIENDKKKEENEKLGKIGVQEVKKFENEKIFFENEKYEKKIGKNVNENNVSYKKKNIWEILHLKILKF